MRSWAEISEPFRREPGAAEEIEGYKRQAERRMNRPWWRLVNAWDRMRGRHKLD